MAVAFKQQGIASSLAASTTVAVSLGVAPTTGNLLIFCMGGDKNTGALTLTGFTKLYELLSTSVSLYYYYKVSDGTETTINPTWASSSAAGNMCWYAEYEDTAVSGSNWQVSASASHITDEVITASWATGTTGASSADGLGVACATIDSSQSWVSATTWTNSYTSRYDGTGGGGRGGVFLSEHAELSGATASSTFGYTGTSDQVSAAIAVWTKLSSGVPPAAPPVHLPFMR